MAALTADRNTQSKSPGLYQYPVEANTQIYKGGIVCINAAGFLIMGAEAAGNMVVGVADENVDNNPGAQGAKNCRVVADRQFRFNATSIAQTSVPIKCYLVDDNTVDETAGANSIVAGTLVSVESSTDGWVYIPGAGMTLAL